MIPHASTVYFYFPFQLSYNLYTDAQCTELWIFSKRHFYFIVSNRQSQLAAPLCSLSFQIDETRSYKIERSCVDITRPSSVTLMRAVTSAFGVTAEDLRHAGRGPRRIRRHAL